jgi:hypothetical protein
VPVFGIVGGAGEKLAAKSFLGEWIIGMDAIQENGIDASRENRYSRRARV